MRIVASESYWHEWTDCPFTNCQRAYCPRHRLLFRVCETAVRGLEGDGDVVGGLHEIWEITGDCPLC